MDSLEGKRSRADSRLTPYSDIAALLVFEHQVRMMNLSGRGPGGESRIALADKHPLTESARAALNELADYMLFIDEALPEGRYRGHIRLRRKIFFLVVPARQARAAACAT